MSSMLMPIIKQKRNSHLSLLTLPWFSFENGHVYCLIQNVKNRFYFLLYSFIYFLTLSYGLYISKLPMHRAFILKKDYQCRPPNKRLVSIFGIFSADKFYHGECTYTYIRMILSGREKKMCFDSLKYSI
jgi:hypothetical protein